MRASEKFRLVLFVVLVIVVRLSSLYALSSLPISEQIWLKITSPKGASVVHGVVEVEVQSTGIEELTKVEVLLNNNVIHTFTSPPEGEDPPTYKFNWDTTSIYQGGGCLLARGYNDKDESQTTSCTPVMIRNDPYPDQ